MFNTKILAVIGISLTITATYSDTTNVYCVHPQDHTAWYWLADGNYRISGEYKNFIYHKKAYVGFYVTEKDYQAAKDACYNKWIPQPAESFLSAWHNFLVETKGKARRLAPGFLSENRFNDRMLMPSINFNPYVSCHPISRYSESRLPKWRLVQRGCRTEYSLMPVEEIIDILLNHSKHKRIKK